MLPQVKQHCCCFSEIFVGIRGSSRVPAPSSVHYFVCRFCKYYPSTDVLLLLRPSQGRDTLYPWIGLPIIKSVLIGTHVCCLLRAKTRAALFLSCTRRLRAKLVPRGGNSWFFIYNTNAPQVLQIRSQYMNLGHYRTFSPIQGSIITLLCSVHYACVCRVSRLKCIQTLFLSAVLGSVRERRPSSP